MDDRLATAARILARIRGEGRFATDVFREELAREERSLDDRRAIAELVMAELRSEPLPQWLVLRLQAAFSDQAEPLIRALASPPPQTLRANRLKIDRDALRDRLRGEGVIAEPTKLSRDGLTILDPTNPFRLAAFQEGLFEVQDEGSQLIAELVAPPPKSAVLDLCAGAGGKTLHLSALLQGKGKVIAHDVSEPKLEELRRRARRAGCSNVETTRELSHVHPVARVLVDAPCSGLGVLRRNPELRLRLKEEAIACFPEQQLELLSQGANWVGAGGRLVYSTCTFLPEENDQVVQAFLQTHPDFEIAPAKEILSRARAEAIGDGVALRLFPHLHGTDAFFAIALRRKR